jgi:hypothetical protein
MEGNNDDDDASGIDTTIDDVIISYKYPRRSSWSFFRTSD